MREIPEPLDLEKISKACDKIILYMRWHSDEEALEAMKTLNNLTGEAELLGFENNDEREDP